MKHLIIRWEITALDKNPESLYHVPFLKNLEEAIAYSVDYEKIKDMYAVEYINK